jgi:hypothetical protein
MSGPGEASGSGERLLGSLSTTANSLRGWECVCREAALYTLPGGPARQLLFLALGTRFARASFAHALSVGAELSRPVEALFPTRLCAVILSSRVRGLPCLGRLWRCPEGSEGLGSAGSGDSRKAWKGRRKLWVSPPGEVLA